MKKLSLILCILFGFAAFVANGQKVTVSLTPTAPQFNDTLKQIMEENLGQMLTEMQQAHSSSRDLLVKNLNLSEGARLNLAELWKTAYTYCDDPYLLLPLQSDEYIGNYVEHLPILFSARNDSTQSYFMEATVYFDKFGQITDFLFPILNNYVPLNDEGGQQTGQSFTSRNLVMTYCDFIRNNLNEGSVKRLQDALADDALIVTRQSITAPTGKKGPVQTRVQNIKQNAKQYLSELQKSLAKEKYRNITFGDSEVYATANPMVYAVLLNLKWNTSTRHDNGYLFLIFDFTNPDAPVIRFLFNEWCGANHVLVQDFIKDLDLVFTQNITSFNETQSKSK